MATVIELNAASFDELVGSADKPVLVDFWAEWCGPCKMIAPVLAEIADEQEEIIVAKVNIDDHQEVAQRFNIMSIPTMLLFENGQVTKQIVGAQPKEALLVQLGFDANN
jgi:thioredoxin 1